MDFKVDRGVTSINLNKSTSKAKIMPIWAKFIQHNCNPHDNKFSSKIMDKETIKTYDQDAQSIARLHSALIPHRIYELIGKYFLKGGATADIGCGIGRDTHWLNQQGFPTIGVDASVAMLKQAGLLYPNHHFIQDSLPTLSRLADSRFKNILCSAVLMHLTETGLLPACVRLLQLLDENGCLLISFRGTNDTSNREQGKLYQPIVLDWLLDFFEENGYTALVQETELEVSRNLLWHNIAIRKN